MPLYATHILAIRFAPLLLAALIALAKRRKSPRAVLGIGLWALVGYGADLIAWYCTASPVLQIALPGAELPQHVGVAGFPVHYLHLPRAGANLSPSGEWWVIALNLTFWILLAWIIAPVLLRRKARKKDDESKTGAGLGLWLFLAGVACAVASTVLLNSWFK